MALSASRDITYERGDLGHVRSRTVAAGVTVYKGALIGSNTTAGTLKPCVDATDHLFFGIALADAAAGAVVECVNGCYAWIPCESNVDADSIGKLLYAHDDATVTETGTLGPAVGRCVNVATGLALVYLGAAAAVASS